MECQNPTQTFSLGFLDNPAVTKRTCVITRLMKSWMSHKCQESSKPRLPVLTWGVSLKKLWYPHPQDYSTYYACSIKKHCNCPDIKSSIGLTSEKFLKRCPWSTPKVLRSSRLMLTHGIMISASQRVDEIVDEEGLDEAPKILEMQSVVDAGHS